MKRILLTLTLAALSACAGPGTTADNRAETIRETLLTGSGTDILVVAHRGDWRYHPENSLPALEHSVAAGVDVVEIDLQMTRDSVLILMHDATLNRTTTGKGNVRDWTLDSLRTLKLKSGCGIKTRYGIPTLEETLVALKGRVMINLDKADRYFDQIVPLLENTGTARQIIMKGSRQAAEVDSLYGRYLDRIVYMPIVDLDKPGAAEAIADFEARLSPAAYELLYNKSDSLPLVMKTQLVGKSLIWYNTLWDTLCGGHDDDPALDDPEGNYGFLINTLGARIIQTDRAEFLLDYLRSRGLHD